MKAYIQHPDAREEFPIAEGCYILESWNQDVDSDCSIARARLPAGETTHWHRLQGITERYLIISGTGRVEVGEEAPTLVNPGDVVFIPAQVRQRICNTGRDDLLFYAICTPRFHVDRYEDLEQSPAPALTPDDLELDLLQRLQQQPDGISEYELLQQLRAEQHVIVASNPCVTADLRLFREHFQLFHLLYRLRDRCWADQSAHIEINPLRICALPYQRVDGSLPGAVDSLRSYYLDRANLEQTGAAEVDEMLGSFWVRMQGLDHRETALQTLGLGSEASYQQARDRYRKLAMEHHPDRGGDAERLQEINLAMDALCKAHGKAGR